MLRSRPKKKAPEVNITLTGDWAMQSFRNQDAESFQALTRPYAAIIPPSLFLSASYIGTVPIPEGSFSPGNQLIVNWPSPNLEEYCFKLISIDFFYQSLPTQGVPNANGQAQQISYYPISGADSALRRGIPLLTLNSVINGGVLAQLSRESFVLGQAANFIDGDLTPNLSMTVNTVRGSDLPTNVKLSFGATYLGWPVNVRRVGAMWLPELYR